MANSKYVVCFGAKSVLELVNSSNSHEHPRGRGRGRFFRRGRGGRYFGRGGRYSPYCNNRFNLRRSNIGHLPEQAAEIKVDTKEAVISDTLSVKSETCSIVQSFSTNCSLQSTERSKSSILEDTKLDVASTSNANVSQSDALVTTSEFPKLENYCMLGDSFCLRMCKAIDPSIQGKFNLCCGGLLVKELKRNLFKCRENLFDKKKVIIMVGMNDVKRCDQLDFNGDLFSLIMKVLEMGAVRIYLCNLPLLPGAFHERIMTFNRAVFGFSKFGDAVHVVDLEKIFLKSSGKIDVNFYERCYKSNKIDIHPNEKGLKLMYNKLCDCLQV